MIGKTFYGKAGIKVTVLVYSISLSGQTFLTYEIEYPRLVLAELNTHRDKSRNSFSSRAVPFDKMLENLTGRPVRFGANQAGMQDKGEDFVTDSLGYYGKNENCDEEWMTLTSLEAWDEAKEAAIMHARRFKNAGYHKQVYNRLLEPFQMMKSVISGTEWDNFFWLRDDAQTDPTLAELAKVMREARDAFTPELLHPGEWHLPYIDTWRDANGVRKYGICDDREIHATLEEAIKVSCARCAAVSYRNEGYGLEKSIELYERLVGAEKKHASALEHCATPMQAAHFYNGVNCAPLSESWEPGVTHADRKGNLWSGNLKGFIQHRKLIPGENYEY
jgi:hypothetical protein